jgi:hypothetical protein
MKLVDKLIYRLIDSVNALGPNRHNGSCFQYGIYNLKNPLHFEPMQSLGYTNQSSTSRLKGEILRQRHPLINIIPSRRRVNLSGTAIYRYHLIKIICQGQC